MTSCNYLYAVACLLTTKDFVQLSQPTLASVLGFPTARHSEYTIVQIVALLAGQTDA